MPDDSNEPPLGVSNTVDGTVFGIAVQAGVISGGVHLHQHFPARPAVSLPYRAGVVPPQATAFQNRGASVARPLHSPVAVTVLSGMGGVGKTQLAIDYAERSWAAGAIDLLVWVAAGSREAIVSSYARVAEALTGRNDPDPEQGARTLLEWLAGTAYAWLMVFDDLRSPADLAGLWPPSTGHSHVVVTTRRRDAALNGERRQTVEVGVFSPAEAQSYLQAALAGRPRLLDGAADLAADLGHLPLALAQAGAYMLDRQMPCTAYRARFADQRRHLATLLPEPEGLPDDHQAAVSATWSLSVELADQLVPTKVARPLLEVTSMLDPHGVPADIFVAPTVLKLLATTSGRLIDEQESRDGLACLHRLSLITLDLGAPSRAVRVHALVQRATREALGEERERVVATAVADAMTHVWPLSEQNTVLGQILRANADALNAAADHLWDSDAREVLFRAGRSLGDSGLVAAAVDYYEALSTTAAERLGPDHQRTLAARGDLAYWRSENGGLAAAVAEHEELLEDCLRALGPDHPETLTTRHNIAGCIAKAGDPAGAAAALEQLLVDRLRVLGPDHADVLVNRGELAHWRGETGDAAGAAAAFQELLAEFLRVRGPDDPGTLMTRNNLAHWRGESGDLGGALAGFEELLADRLRVLGPGHPSTLNTRGQVAYWHGEAGNPVGAVTELQALLADQLRLLGADHQDTLSTRDNIAHWRGHTGDADGAVAALKELLADRLRVLGPGHPDTLTTLGNYAHWQSEAGDPAGAAQTFERMLGDCLRILGPDHRHTLTTRHNLARCLNEAGDANGAVTALKELLADYLRVFGPDHLDTLITRHNLAFCRGNAGDPARAVAELENLLPDYVRVAGPDHPHTLLTRESLATWKN